MTCFRPACGLITALISLSAPWSAASGRPASIRLNSAAEVFALAESATAQGDSSSAEKLLRVLLEDRSSTVRTEARFRLAKLLAANGNQVEAAVLFRRVVDEEPKAAPARLELAGLLYKMGNEGEALRQLRAASTLDLPLNIARVVDRMSAALQSSRPFAIQLEVALAPDSNINGATHSETLGTVFGDFTFDEDSKARSGVGAAVRGLAQGQLNISNNARLTAHASIDAALYRKSQFNDVSLELAGGPEFQVGPVRLSAEAGAGQQWYGMKPYQRTLRLSSSATIRVDQRSQLRVDGSARWSRNRFNDLQSGKGLSVAARYERALSPQLTVSLGGGMDRFRAKDDAYSTRSWTIGAVAYREIGRMTLEIGGEIGRLEAEDRLVLLPEARRDKIGRLHVGAVFRKLSMFGFSPTARLVFERNVSNVEFYDFKRTRTEFGISRAF